MRKPKYKVKVNQEENQILQKIINKHSEKQNIVWRAKIIQMAGSGVMYSDIAKTLGVGNATVTLWAERWGKTVGKPILKRLQDLPRPGTPDKFSAEQVCKIIALACENQLNMDDLSVIGRTES